MADETAPKLDPSRRISSRILSLVFDIAFGVGGVLIFAGTTYAAFIYLLLPAWRYLQEQVVTREGFASTLVSSILSTLVAAAVIGLVFFAGVRPILRDSARYRARLENRPAPESEDISDIRRLLSKLQSSSSDEIISQKLNVAVQEARTQIEQSIRQSADVSDPEKLFVSSRERLLNEAIRIDGISRRNLVFGILFSAFALGFLAWPLIAQTIFANLTTTNLDADVFRWVAQSYLPRFAVGLLLQFVGFFFLRLYVANELDLKHNKNEITNIEMKMMGLQLAKEFGDAPSKKEVVRSFAHTERNFILKKNEKSVSTESLSEYNDVKSLVDKLVSKIPKGN